LERQKQHARWLEILHLLTPSRYRQLHLYVPCISHITDALSTLFQYFCLHVGTDQHTIPTLAGMLSTARSQSLTVIDSIANNRKEALSSQPHRYASNIQPQQGIVHHMARELVLSKEGRQLFSSMIVERT
jgi:hypothetical protein